MKELTTSEVATWLAENGVTDGTVTRKTVNRWMSTGRFPGARKVYEGRGSAQGRWLAPLSSVEAFVPPTKAGRRGRPGKETNEQG